MQVDAHNEKPRLAIRAGRGEELDGLSEGKLRSEVTLVTVVTFKAGRDCLPSNHEVL